MDKYIVVINGKKPLFLVDEKDEACLFDSRDEAIEKAEANFYAKAKGYQIFIWYYLEE